MSASDLERSFLFFLKAEKLPTPQTEYRFHPVRKWRFDLAYPERKVAVELEGGAYVHGRHVRGSGFEADCLKYSEAAIAGWTVIRCTARMVEDGTAVELLRRALESRAA